MTLSTIYYYGNVFVGYNHKANKFVETKLNEVKFIESNLKAVLNESTNRQKDKRV